MDDAIDPEVGIGSTMYCEGNTTLTRTCTFHNLCYDGQNLLFHIAENLTEGMLRPDAELMNLGVYASSPKLPIKVHDYGMSYKSIVQWIKLRTFLFFRGHSRNYLHSLLDDYMGLFAMMHFRNEGHVSNDNLVVIFDDYPMFEEQDRFAEIMQVFSLNIPRRLTKMWSLMKEDDGFVCFKDVTAGPAQHQLAGPGFLNMDPEFVHSFRDYITEMIDATKPEIMDDQVRHKKRCLIIQRDTNRRILNMKELVAGLENSFPKLQVWPVQLERLPFRDQVRQVIAATILVGMHGAGFANLLFLSKYASVIELFPYKVNRPLFANIIDKVMVASEEFHSESNQTYKVRYYQWQNRNPNNTVFHDELLEHHYLTPAQMDEVVNDPEQIHKSRAGQDYWLSQDSYVDIPAIVELVNESLAGIPPIRKPHLGPFKPPRHVRTTVEEQSTLQGTTLNLGAKSTQPDDTRPPPSLPPITDGPSAQSSHFMLLLPLAIGLLLICLRRQYRLAYAAAHLD